MDSEESTVNIRKAELARAQLARDLGAVFRAGDRLLQRGRSLLKKALPIGIALAAGGLVLVAALASRRRSRGFWHREPSFVAELLRKAAFSAVAVLANRAARRLPMPRLPAPTNRRQLRRADVDPMLPPRT